MTRTGFGRGAALLLCMALGAGAHGEAAARFLVYRQQRGPEYRVTVSRTEDKLEVSYRYGGQRPYQRDSDNVRDVSTGRLESCVVPIPGGERRYIYTAGQITVTQPGKPALPHAVEIAAQTELLDAICAFVATGRPRERVLYVFDRDTFATQGFVMTRKGGERATTAAGTFDCVKVKLALDFPAGLFFSLDFLVAADPVYPFVVSGRTQTGGPFELVSVE